MIVKDKKLNEKVDVYCQDCPKYKCYWPRTHPGVFIPVQWYKNIPKKEFWICGTREAHGCPDNPEMKETYCKSWRTKRRAEMSEMIDLVEKAEVFNDPYVLPGCVVSGE